MELFKKLFFDTEDNTEIGLCKFNSSICENNKQEEPKRKQRKDISLSEILKKPI